MIPDFSYCTPESIPRCGICAFSYGDPHAPPGRQEWCKLLQNTTTCRAIESPVVSHPEGGRYVR
jgi:hypothetical protein